MPAKQHMLSASCLQSLSGDRPCGPQIFEVSEDLAPGTLQPLSRSSAIQTFPTEALCAARTPFALPVLTLKPGTSWGTQNLLPNRPLSPQVRPSSLDIGWVNKTPGVPRPRPHLPSHHLWDHPLELTPPHRFLAELQVFHLLPSLGALDSIPANSVQKGLPERASLFHQSCW